MDVGLTANFSAIAAGTGALTYQWMSNNVALTDGGSVSRIAHAQSDVEQRPTFLCGHLHFASDRWFARHHQFRAGCS